jgi:hypothetical protein
MQHLESLILAQRVINLQLQRRPIKLFSEAHLHGALNAHLVGSLTSPGYDQPPTPVQSQSSSSL